jgi:hypothetical protein
MASTEVVDTAGCFVTIMRSGTPTRIEKVLVDYLVLGADTIRYRGYVCGDTVKRTVRFRDTPSQKLYSTVTQLPIVRQPLSVVWGIAYVPEPLYGDDFFTYRDVLNASVKSVLRDAGCVMHAVTLDWLLEHVGTYGVTPRYALLTTRLARVTRRWTRRGPTSTSLSAGPLGTMRLGGLANRERCSSEVLADAAIVDLWTATRVLNIEYAAEETFSLPADGDGPVAEMISDHINDAVESGQTADQMLSAAQYVIETLRAYIPTGSSRSTYERHQSK